ncbi:MAG: phage holin family protein [Pirellulaceae bacterium]|nr:phage holin family protein [Planctomycetales bacterium]
MNGRSQVETDNGHPKSSGSIANVMHDVLELGELQVALLAADANAAARRVTVPLIVAASGICTALAGLPLLLMGIAEWLVAMEVLPRPAALASVGCLGIVLAVLLMLLGWRGIRGSVRELLRSLDDLRANLACVKRTLRPNRGH